MTTESAPQTLRTAMSTRFSTLIENNSVEVAGAAAFALWIAIVTHHSALFTAPSLPALITAKAVPIALATSIICAMAAATCLHFLIAIRTPLRFADVLASTTSRVRFSLASVTLVAYLTVLCGHLGLLLTGQPVVAALAGITAGYACWQAWRTMMRVSLQRAEHAGSF